MYKIGDKIFYSMHGAGVIDKVETIEVLGEKQQCYVLILPISSMKVMIPLKSTDHSKLREIITDEEAQKVIEILESDEFLETKTWNKRYRENMQTIKNGDILGITLIFKSLYRRDKDKTLSMSERNMFNLSRQILFSELMLCLNKTEEEIDELVSQKVSI